MTAVVWFVLAVGFVVGGLRVRDGRWLWTRRTLSGCFLCGDQMGHASGPCPLMPPEFVETVQHASEDGAP